MLLGTAPDQIFLPAVGYRNERDGHWTDLQGQNIYWAQCACAAAAFPFQRQVVYHLNFNLSGGFIWGRPVASTSFAHVGALVRCVEDVIIPVESVTLNYTTVTLTPGETATLTATVLPANATFGHITWTSSNNAAARVDANGLVTFSGGIATITATTGCGTHTATATVTVEGNIFSDISNSLDGVVIDGIRWATRNVDMPGTFAQNPQDAGMFYQWNIRIGWSSTNPLVNSDGGTTWNTTTPAGIRWYRENDPCPDGWRVPTHSELSQLHSAGSVWGVYNGVAGRLFGTSPYQIFLPAANWRSDFNGSLPSHLLFPEGWYWGLTRFAVLSFSSTNSRSILGGHHSYGFSVRVVSQIS